MSRIYLAVMQVHDQPSWPILQQQMTFADRQVVCSTETAAYSCKEAFDTEAAELLVGQVSCLARLLLVARAISGHLPRTASYHAGHNQTHGCVHKWELSPYIDSAIESYACKSIDLSAVSYQK